MSLLDVLNKQGLVGKSTSFTEQAQKMKQALTGKEIAPESVQKSNIQEQVAAAQVEEAERPLLKGIETTQKKLDLESQKIMQQRSQLSAEYKQKENELISQTQRQFDEIYAKTSEAYATLSNEQKIANLEQLEFLNNLADRAYVTKLQIEGTKRRLDNEIQWKTAAMYAIFDDQMDMLNEDLTFKKALEADERSFREYLSTIEPQAALEAALIEQKSVATQKAYGGIGEGIAKYGPTVAENIMKEKPKQ